MRILIYGLNFSPELTGIGKYTGEMAAWLSEHGHDVQVVAAPPYYPEWRIGENHSGCWYRSEQLEGVRVIRCPIWVPSKPSGSKRILHLLSFALSSFPALLWALKLKPEVVIVVAPALFCAPFGWLAARIVGAKSWLHIQDFEIEAAFDMGLLKGCLIKKWVLAAERRLLTGFDRVSTISERMLDRLATKTKGKCNLALFVNWVDINHITPLQGVNPFREELGIGSDKLILLYSGNMGQKQGLEMVVEAARELTDQPQFQFIMCGDGVARNRLRAMAEGLDNILWIDLQPVERLNELLNLADIHLLPQSADVADLVMPSKLTGMLASAGPVIATSAPGTQVAKVVAHAGYIVPPGDIKAFVNAIRMLGANKSLRYRLGDAGRALIKNEWNKEKVLKVFEDEIHRLVASQRLKKAI
jgi:colanic acid biosynthesis glycosyl transferase WcaI